MNKTPHDTPHTHTGTYYCANHMQYELWEHRTQRKYLTSDLTPYYLPVDEAIMIASYDPTGVPEDFCVEMERKLWREWGLKYGCENGILIGRLYDNYRAINLECSTKGDKRFSAFNAKVKINGHLFSIEDAYQLAKRTFGQKPPTSWRDAKGKAPDFFVVDEVPYHYSMIWEFYTSLWERYLEDNHKLVYFLYNFEKLHDTFAQVGHVDQATAISNYLNGSRSSFKLPDREIGHYMPIINKVYYP